VTAEAEAETEEKPKDEVVGRVVRIREGKESKAKERRRKNRLSRNGSIKEYKW